MLFLVEYVGGVVYVRGCGCMVYLMSAGVG